MSFYKFSEKTDYVEDKMQRKMHPVYQPRLEALNPGSDLIRANHQPHAFDEYWRSELPRAARFVMDPSARSSAYLKEQMQELARQQQSVKDLDRVYDEPSDDLPAAVPKGRRK